MTLTLTWLIDQSGTAGEPTEPYVLDEELCTGESNSTLVEEAGEQAIFLKAQHRIGDL